MRFKFRRFPWLSAGLLTVSIACIGLTGCESASREARPPENLGALIRKPPEEVARERNTGGGGGQPSTTTSSSVSSSRSSGGVVTQNPISSLRRPATGVRPMGNSQPASRGGTRLSKGP